MLDDSIKKQLTCSGTGHEKLNALFLERDQWL